MVAIEEDRSEGKFGGVKSPSTLALSWLNSGSLDMVEILATGLTKRIELMNNHILVNKKP